MKQISGWGKYPVVRSELFTPRTYSELRDLLDEGAFAGIARGMGRSYGDSSLSHRSISSLLLNHILDFDETSGAVCCSAGVTLDDLLDVFVPRGWFLPVTPGTKFVSVGGAVASDVHGKNHHVEGSFSDHVSAIKLMLGNGDIVDCSREMHPDLFRATCGGMGLTGVILEVDFKLKPIASAYVNETTLKASNLEHALTLFEEHEQVGYSVAWIDCSAKGRHLGRSLLMLGEHGDDGRFPAADGRRLSVPFDLPGVVLNRFSIRAFNALYYHRVRRSPRRRLVHFAPYFYPLDGIHDWNRIYGKSGFTQYQFVVPKDGGREGLRRILDRIAASGLGSFLAVLKVFGRGNENFLSFPMEGFTLALDFKLEGGLFEFLDELDRIVLDYGWAYLP